MEPQDSISVRYLAFDLFGNVLIGLKLVNIGSVLFLGIAFPVSLQSHA